MAAPTTALPGSAVAARPRAVLVILSTAVFMVSLDLFIVNVALHALGRDLHSSSLADLSWVLNAYAIVYAALLVPAGRLADRFGRKHGFLLGLATFVIASLGCALSGTLWTIVAFRGLQAAGAALLTPASLGLLLQVTPPANRASAVRVWAASGSLAAALGPVVGGLLVEASWRWIFLINLPVGLAAMLAAVILVPGTDTGDERRAPLPDLLGGAVLIISIGSLSTGLVKAPDWGWASGRTIGILVFSAAALGLFLRRSRRHPAPVIDLSILRHRTFAWSNATALLFSAAFAAILLSVVLWLEQIWGWSALKTGLAVAPGPLMVPLFAVVGHRLTRRYPAGVVTAAGALLQGVGTVMILSAVGTHPSYAADLLPGWLVGGVGVGLTLPLIMSSATSVLAAHEAATGSAIISMARQIGAVLGISVLVAVLAAGDGPSAFQHAWWVIAGISLAATAAALRTSPTPSDS